GVLPMLLVARRHGIQAALVPDACRREAALAAGMQLFPVGSLPPPIRPLSPPPPPPRPSGPPRGPGLPMPPPLPATQGAPLGAPDPDLTDVRGQPLARRAPEIAAAGGHNLLLVGPPGSGTTMLARPPPGGL